MSAWPPNNKRRFRRVRVGAGLTFLLFLGGCVAVNWVGDRLPSDVSVGSNIGPTPCDVTLAGQCARHLTPTTSQLPARAAVGSSTTVHNPSVTTTVTKPSAAIVTYGPERPCRPGDGGDFLVVVDGRSVCVIRTPMAAQLVWALTFGQ